MKAILMSIRPEWVAKILNGEKTIEIRKKFPKDYVGWVYIYCTKNDYEEVFGRKQKIYLCDMRGKTESGFDFMTLTKNEDTEKFIKDNLNGKVVARFWCDKVENIKWHKDTAIDLDYYKVVNVIENKEILKASCLQLKELEDYLQIKNAKNIPTTWGITFNLGYAIHITKLEIFDKPMQIKDLVRPCKEPIDYCGESCLECPYAVLSQYSDYDDALPLGDMKKVERCLLITKLKAPQSWCYVEI